MQTFISGKDSALEDSIARMQSGLKDLGFNIEEASWLNPVAHVWSVHLRDQDAPMCFTNGKGSTKMSALASALGEFYERLACNYFFADWHLGEQEKEFGFTHYPNEKWFEVNGDQQWPNDLLDKHCLKEYDPENELQAKDLYDLNSEQKKSSKGNPQICALPYTRQSDQKTIYFPVNVIANLYVSNGMSAGNTKTEARVQALSEIFERYAKNKIISEGICLPDVPQTVLDRFPSVCQAIEELRGHGFGILVKDASLGGNYPVINVTLVHPQDGGVFASFGAHPQFGVALERTLTELLQGRSLDQLDIFKEPEFDLNQVANTDNLIEHFTDSNGLIHWSFFKDQADYQFCDWNFSGTTSEEFDHMISIFHQHEKQVYIADHQHLGMYACRIHVPGMSEIYPFEDLVWDNNNQSVALRKTLMNLEQATKDELNLILNSLEDQSIPDELEVSEYVGIAFDTPSVWGSMRMAELKFRIQLALGESQEALHSIRFTLLFGAHAPQKDKFLRALSSLIESQHHSLEANSIYSMQCMMYGEETIKRARTWIDERESLKDLNIEWKSLKKHGALLSAYKKIQIIKKNHTAIIQPN